MSDDSADHCVWTEADDCWNTDCGSAFSWNEGGPLEHGMAFCCFCGRPVVEERVIEEEDVDEATPTG